MPVSNKVNSNLFEDNQEYPKMDQQFWVNITDEHLYYDFRDICREEKAEVDTNASKEVRKTSNDQRFVFKRYVPKSRILFVLYVMGLWRPEGQELPSAQLALPEIGPVL